MEPRLKNSNKWTAIPKDYLKQVQNALKQSFPIQSKAGEWVTEGRIYPSELLIRLGYLEKGRLHQANFEVSVEYDAKKDNVTDLLGLAIDVGASLLEEYFGADSNEDFPRIWQPFDVEKRQVFVQFSGTNSKLENEANRILGLKDDDLVQGEGAEESEEMLKAIKARIGLDPDEGGEDDGDNGPSSVH